VTEDERTDEVLLAATAGGDDAAFAVLVRRYIRAATFLAAQDLRGRLDAEDIAQDAFVVVYQQARKFERDRPFAVRGLRTEEVATMYSISESTVRQHVFRARSALQVRLGGGSTERKES
jgi:DNA-directed RNA polymerase specialized sigma24 family protein